MHAVRPPITHLLTLICAAVLFLLAFRAVAIPSPPAAPDKAGSPSILLVASKQLTHPAFHESVVLVTRHGRGVPIGIIINRPQNIPLNRIFPSIPEAEGLLLHDGGPVARGQISFLFRGGEMPADTIRVAEETYLAHKQVLLGELLTGKRTHRGLRVVNGFAAWAEGQLENEISRGDWHVLPVDTEILFEHPAETLWPTLYRRATQTSAQRRP